MINGFRGIREGKVNFDEVTILIGANNSGKTTIIEALALLLGRDRLLRSISEHDFHNSCPAPEDRIQITGTIIGFESNDPADHPKWFREGRGVPKWLSTSSGNISSEPGDDLVLACQISFAARFDEQTLEAETIRYFFDDESQEDPFSEEGTAAAVPLTLIREVGYFLVPASRSWDRMMSFGSELFRKAVSYAGGKPVEALLEERNRLRQPESPLEEDEKFTSFVADVDRDLSAVFGRSTALKLRLTSTDSPGVLDAVVPHFVQEEAVALPSNRHGSGIVSLQTLMLLMRLGNLRTTRGESFLMALEEPELHLPPPQQRRILHMLQALSSQTIVTTHSPIVATAAEPNNVLLVNNDSGLLSARPLSKDRLNREATNVARSLFLADRATTINAVMSPTVLVPEGKTDARWLLLLARVLEISSFALGEDLVDSGDLGVIPTKEARIRDTYLLLREVHPKVIPIVDGDGAGSEYCGDLAELDDPCPLVLQWPDHWTIETVVAWILDGDATVVEDVGRVLSIEGPVTATLIEDKLRNTSAKTDEIVQSMITDQIIQSSACCSRVRGLFTLLKRAVESNGPHDGVAQVTLDNGATMLKKFNADFQGI